MVVDNARKVSFGASSLKNVIGNATTVYAVRGKKVATIELTDDKLTAEVVRKLILGPTGNLRAPAILRGDSFIVGFNEELYQQLLCQ